ncbi:dockerin type I domain-containing protein [Paenibacillus apiarius]
MVAAHYGKTKLGPDWDQVKHMDVNRDGKIDIQDLAAVARFMLK